MKTLTLSLKKQWFDMIKAGIKKEEYRDCSEHWIIRFVKDFKTKSSFRFEMCFRDGKFLTDDLVSDVQDCLNYLDYDSLVFTLGCPNCGTVYGVGYSDVPHCVEKIHRICDTCMMPIEVNNPWNDKDKTSL